MVYIREAIVEKALITECEKRGGKAYKLTVPGRRNVPDRLLLLPGGRAIFVECKAPGQKARPAQQRELERLVALGFEAAVFDGQHMEWIFDGNPGDAPEFHPDLPTPDSGFRNRRKVKE